MLQEKVDLCQFLQWLRKLILPRQILQKAATVKIGFRVLETS